MVRFELSRQLLILCILTCLGIVTIIIFFANNVGEHVAVAVGNLLYIPIQVTLLAVAIWIVRYFGMDGIHGIGWLSFLGFAASWFAGDMMWLSEEMVFHTELYPSVSDLLYLFGYPFLLIFVISYITPFRDAISKKMVLASACVAVVLVAFSINQIHIEDTESFDVYIMLAYPVFDGIILIPVLLGLALFFKSTTDLMGSLILFGVMATFVGDILFAHMEYSGIYHTGSLAELPFYFSYVLLIFGLIHHKKTMNMLCKDRT